jgi:hypothetical protein
MNEERVQILKELGNNNNTNSNQTPRAIQPPPSQLAPIQQNKQQKQPQQLSITYSEQLPPSGMSKENYQPYSDQYENNKDDILERDDESDDDSKSMNMMERLHYAQSDSILKYLPGVDLREVQRPMRVNSAFEMITGPAMRERYQARLAKQLADEAVVDRNVMFNLVETTDDVNANNGRAVRLSFLNNQPYLKYMDLNRGSNKKELVDVNKTVPVTKKSVEKERDETAFTQFTVTDRVGEVSDNEADFNEFPDVADGMVKEKSSVGGKRAVVLYDMNRKLGKIERSEGHVFTPKSTPNLPASKLGSSHVTASGSVKEFPPLTMNALMEYKSVLKAPGKGEFYHGRPKVFRLND